MLTLFLNLIDKIIALVKLRQSDRQQLFKEVVEPLFVQVQPVVDDYFAIFRSAQVSVTKAKSRAALAKAVVEIRDNREKMLHVRRQVRELAIQIREHVKDKHVVAFSNKVAHFFYSSEYVTGNSGSGPSRLVELCDYVMLNDLDKDLILHYVLNTLRQCEERWVAIAATYASIRINSMTPSRYLE
jgi:hypothetical protein